MRQSTPVGNNKAGINGEFSPSHLFKNLLIDLNLSIIGGAGDATITKTMPRPSTATIEKPKRPFVGSKDVRNGRYEFFFTVQY